MELQDRDNITPGLDIQKQIIVHMARFDKVLSTAVKLLKLDHFSWGPAIVLARVLFDYYGRFERRPPFTILAEEVKTMLKSHGETYLHESEIPTLLEIMDLIRTEPEDGLESAWALEAIKKYRTRLMLFDLKNGIGNALQTGQGVETVVEQMTEIASSAFSDEDDGVLVASGLDTSQFKDDGGTMGKITTGLSKMDNAIGGGLAEKELCLLAALQGVGKTNMMLNFMTTAAVDGRYNLLLSLEMPAQSIQERLIAMSAFIPAIKFRKAGIKGMTDYERKRIRMVQETDLSQKLIVADYSGRTCTMQDIISFVGKWLRGLEKMGVRDKAGVVCIDYVNFIEVPGLSGDRTNLSPDVVKRTIDDLKKKVSNAYDLRVYIASQTTSKAEGNRILSRSHVAWGFHSSDAIDFGFGLAPKDDNRYKELESGIDVGTPEDSGVTAKGRELVLSSFKARVGDTTAFAFYQAPTLRVFNNEAEYRDSLGAVNDGLFSPKMSRPEE